MTLDSLRELSQGFQIHGTFIAAEPYGSGHINDTYRVTYNQAGRITHYILQRINHNLFTDIPAVMENIERICTHSQNTLKQANHPDAERRSLTLVPTREGTSFLNSKSKH